MRNKSQVQEGERYEIICKISLFQSKYAQKRAKIEKLIDFLLARPSKEVLITGVCVLEETVTVYTVLGVEPEPVTLG